MIIATFSLFMPVICCLVLIILAVAILKLNDWLFHRPPNRQQMEEFQKKFESRLRKPDFQSLEKHFGCPFPEEIRELYNNREEILRFNFDVVDQNGSEEKTWAIAYYQPADMDHVLDGWEKACEVFEFANDGCGNGYTIDPKKENSPVMFYDHETSEWEKVADNFSAFMKMQRKGELTST